MNGFDNWAINHSGEGSPNQNTVLREDADGGTRA